MNKAHVTHLLSEYLEGGMSNPGASKVKAHLAFCNACRQALAETERNIETLKKTPAVRPPEDLEARIIERVHKELNHKMEAALDREVQRRSWFTPLRGLMLAA